MAEINRQKSDVQNPQISILVPVYNVEKYLVQALDSIKNQTIKDFECILLDDGSTDQSGKICDRYARENPCFKVIHKSNSGYGASMNIGLETAIGKYIGIVEPDDFIELDMYEKLIKYAEDKNVNVVRSNYFTHTNGIDTERRYIPNESVNKIINPKIDYKIFYCDDIAIWTGIYNRQFLNDYNIRFLETPGASYQDTGFFYKVLFCAEKIYLADDCFYHYRIDNPNSSMRSNKKIFAIAHEMHEVERFFSLYPDDYKHCKKMLNHLKIGRYKWNLGRLEGHSKEQFRKVFSAEFDQMIKDKALKLECYNSKTLMKRRMELNPNNLCLKIKYILVLISRIFYKDKINWNIHSIYILFGLIKIGDKKIELPKFYED